MKIVEITINPKGEAKVQTKGFTGPSCREASKALEQALGLDRYDTATADLHQSVNQTQRESQRT